MRRTRGFTLLELLIALSAGLLLSLAVFSFMRGAMGTFVDTQRTNDAELGIRSAIERIRVDLQRAAFMSSPNVRADTRARVETNARLVDGIGSLGALRYLPGGSVGNMLVGSMNYATVNGLTPDAIDIAGNFTTTDDFEVEAIDVGASGACSRIHLNPSNAAVARLLGGGPLNGDAGVQAESVRQAFQPVPPNQSGRFLVRIVDPAGCAQYLPTCNTTSTAGVASGRPWVDVEGTFIMAGSGGDQCGLPIGGAGARVNPVQWVRYELSSTARLLQATGQSATTYAALGESVNDAGQSSNGKFNLMRTFLSADRTYVGVPEIIAEYAVDLRFALTVDDSLGTDGLAPRLHSYDWDDASGALWGQDVNLLPWAPSAAERPNRIRSMRVRLATRAALPDREQNVPSPQAGYLYRYCMQNTTPCRQFARVRSVTTEVQLTNLARAFY